MNQLLNLNPITPTYLIPSSPTMTDDYAPTNTSPDDDLEICACDPPFSPVYTPPRPPLRSNIFPDPGFLVAYPSRGGLVLMHPSPLDLQHLNLPRTHDTPRSSLPSEEDALADLMLRLGAQWWPSWALYAQHADHLDSGTVYDFHFPPDVYVGYPSSGGVWVVGFSPDRGNLGKHPRTSLPQRPEAWNRVMRHVLTMDERCEALKGFGARFYDDVDVCGEICKTVREGVEEFARYEALLRRMEDGEYRGRWFMAFHVSGRVVEVWDAGEDKWKSGWGCVLF